MDITLVRSQTVMKLVSAFRVGGALPASDSGAWFVREDDEVGSERRLQMEYDVWEDMGRPHTITVTIEPGDRLNQED